MSTKVALAGATGNLGPAILKALVDASFSVTVLSRKGGNGSKVPSNPNVTVKEVDYTSVESLKAALQGVEAVVSTIAGEGISGQNTLIDASVAAGVKRFIPSEFGSNTLNAKTAELPVFAGKVATRKYLEQVSAANKDFTYTLVINGPFLDWGLKVGFFANPAAHSATVFNGGGRKFSASNLATIGQAVAGSIKNQAATANRAVYVQDTALSQNQIIQWVKEKDGKEWTTTAADAEQVRLDGLKALASGNTDNIGAVFVGFIQSAVHNPEYEGNWADKNDNALLGIKGLNEEETKKLVQSFV